MANTARDSTTLQSYGELSYKDHDPTEVPVRVSAQNWRDFIISLSQFGQAFTGSSISLKGSTDTTVLTYSEESTDAPVASTDVTVTAAAGTITVGSKGTYLVNVSGNLVASTAGGSATKIIGVQVTSTAGSTAQNGTASIAMSTTPTYLNYSWILKDVAASNSIDVTITGTTADSSNTHAEFSDGTALVRRLA